MASASFVVKNHLDQNVTFLLQSQDSKVARYIVASSSLAEPVGCEISHDLKATGAKGTDRHLVKFFKAKNNEVTGGQDVATVSMQFSVPRTVNITDGDMFDLASFAENYCTEANIALLVDGVTL